MRYLWLIGVLAIGAVALSGCGGSRTEDKVDMSAQDKMEPAPPPEGATTHVDLVCPVCGMTVDEKDAVVLHEGDHDVYFCSEGDMGKYKADPAKYAAKKSDDGEDKMEDMHEGGGMDDSDKTGED